MRACVCARACVRVRWCECGAVQHAERAPQLDDTDNKRAPQTQTGQLTRRCCHSTFVGGASGLLNGRARGAAAVPVFVSAYVPHSRDPPQRAIALPLICASRLISAM